MLIVILLFVIMPDVISTLNAACHSAVILLNINVKLILLFNHAECHSAECYSAEGHYAGCHSAKCLSAKRLT
jgi:hypothetical protein